MLCKLDDRHSSYVVAEAVGRLDIDRNSRLVEMHTKATN